MVHDVRSAQRAARLAGTVLGIAFAPTSAVRREVDRVLYERERRRQRRRRMLLQGIALGIVGAAFLGRAARAHRSPSEPEQ